MITVRELAEEFFEPEFKFMAAIMEWAAEYNDGLEIWLAMKLDE